MSPSGWGIIPATVRRALSLISCGRYPSLTKYSLLMNTALMVTVANELFSKCGRCIGWLSTPVPAYRTGADYFRPLQDLDLSEQPGVDLMLGLVHESEVEGSRERIEAASEVIPTFQIASAWGLARHTQDEMDAIFGAYNTVL